MALLGRKLKGKTPTAGLSLYVQLMLIFGLVIGGGFKPEVQHLLPSKVRRCHHLVRPRPISNFSPKSASPLPA